MSTKVLWFSRHDMTPDQRAALGDSEITQIDKTIKHASEVADEISQCDVLAVVAPVELQKEFLEQAGNKPVITAVNDRILVPTENGESKSPVQLRQVGTGQEDRYRQGRFRYREIREGQGRKRK